MDFLDRIDFLISQKGINRNIIAKEVEGINHSSFHTWKSRGTIPSGEVIKKIADYFGVTTDFLLGRQPTEAELQKVKEMQEKYNLKQMKTFSAIVSYNGVETPITYTAPKELTPNELSILVKSIKSQTEKEKPTE